MRTESQVKRIFDYLMGGSSLTPLEALKKFGSLNLRNRICNIRDQYGITAEREMIEVGDKRVMRYWFNNKLIKK